MEEKINIAKILKDKPQGTKLYSILSDGECFLNEVSEDSIYIDIDNRKRFWCFTVYGSTHSFPNGCVLLFPSREMRNWRKFNWKKGDVLVSNDGKVEVIFEKFEGDTYQSFIGKHHLESLDENLYYQDGGVYPTASFKIETEDAAQTYIKTIEEKLDGKLNLESLEIEKTQSEFKDGDIVCISGMGYHAYGIAKSIDNSSKKLEYYVLNDMSTLKFEDWLSFEDKQIQPITETQQTILFEALAKKGKAWDSEKKQIVDLPKKCEFKVFEKVLVRESKTDEWTPNFFFKIHRDDERYVMVCGDMYNYCIPYNEETSHLLGTTDEWKGGEG